MNMSLAYSYLLWNPRSLRIESKLQGFNCVKRNSLRRLTWKKGIALEIEVYVALGSCLSLLVGTFDVDSSVIRSGHAKLTNRLAFL